MHKLGSLNIEYVLSFIVVVFLYQMYTLKLGNISMEYALQSSIHELENLLITRPLDKSALSKIHFVISQTKILCGYSNELSQ